MLKVNPDFVLLNDSSDDKTTGAINEEDAQGNKSIKEEMKVFKQEMVEWKKMFAHKK